MCFSTTIQSQQKNMIENIYHDSYEDTPPHVTFKTSLYSLTQPMAGPSISLHNLLEGPIQPHRTVQRPLCRRIQLIEGPYIALHSRLKGPMQPYIALQRADEVARWLNHPKIVGEACMVICFQAEARSENASHCQFRRDRIRQAQKNPSRVFSTVHGRNQFFEIDGILQASIGQL